MINGELSVFLLTYMSPNTNVTHSIKARLVSFWSFGMYLSFEPKKNSLRQSADSQSTKYSVSEHMVDPVWYTLDVSIWRDMYYLLFRIVYCKCKWVRISSPWFNARFVCHSYISGHISPKNKEYVVIHSCTIDFKESL